MMFAGPPAPAGGDGDHRRWAASVVSFQEVVGGRGRECKLGTTPQLRCSIHLAALAGSRCHQTSTLCAGCIGSGRIVVVGELLEFDRVQLQEIRKPPRQPFQPTC